MPPRLSCTSRVHNAEITRHTKCTWPTRLSCTSRVHEAPGYHAHHVYMKLQVIMHITCTWTSRLSCTSRIHEPPVYHALLCEHNLTGYHGSDMALKTVTEVCHRTVGDDCATEVCDRPVGDDCVTEVCDRPVGDDCVTEVCDRPVGDDCVTEVCDRPAGDDCVTEVWDRPVGDDCVTEVWDRSVGQTSGWRLSTKYDEMWDRPVWQICARQQWRQTHPCEPGRGRWWGRHGWPPRRRVAVRDSGTCNRTAPASARSNWRARSCSPACHLPVEDEASGGC